MKRFASVFLALALLLTLGFAAVPAHAADGNAGAMRAYAEIVANAESYDFVLDSSYQSSISGYQYALVDLAEGGGVPTLLLSMSEEGPAIGYMTYARVFQYDSGSGTVRAPSGLITGGTAAVGGYRGSFGLLRGHLATVSWAAMTGQGSYSQVDFSGDSLTFTTLWSGMIFDAPDSYRLEEIEWKDIDDNAVFTPYLPTGPLAAVAYVGDSDACSMSADMARAYAGAIGQVTAPVVHAALFDAGGGVPMLWIAWGDDVFTNDYGSYALTGSYGSQLYGYGSGLVRCPKMTQLLRAGEFGVIARNEIPYYSEFGVEINLFHLTGGGILQPAFATGFADPFGSSTLNGRSVSDVTDEMTLCKMADPNLRVLLSANDGPAGMLFLGGKWSTGGEMRDALLAYADEKDPPAPANIAYASTQTVSVDGRNVEFQCYALKDAKGNPTNYIKLRDLAILLNGTPAQFAVGWDGSVNILTHSTYTPNGSELNTPFRGDRSYLDTRSVTKLDGQIVDLAAFMLTDDAGGGYTYYKLRDLGQCIGFNVGWSAARGIFVETDKPYDPAD